MLAAVATPVQARTTAALMIAATGPITVPPSRFIQATVAARSRHRSLPLDQAKLMLWFFKGNERIRWPVALKYAFNTAGAATQMVGSPTPPHRELPPEGHDHRFDLRHLGDAHRVVLVEICLLDRAVLDGALLIEQRGQTVDERAEPLAVRSAPGLPRRCSRLLRLYGEP